MAKIKIYKYAKENNLVSKDVVEKLKVSGVVGIKNQMSSVEESLLEKLFRKNTKPVSPKPVNKSESKKDTSVKPKITKPKIENTSKDTALSSAAEPVKAKKTATVKPKKDWGKNKKAENIEVADLTKTKTQLKKERREAREQELKNEKKTAYWHEDLTVGSLSTELDIPTADIIMKLMSLGIMANANQHVDRDALEILAMEYNLNVENKEVAELVDANHLINELVENAQDTTSRSPIIAIMGHVDHGKTTLLDTIRNTKVASREAGGITQHIGAYKIDYKGQKLTFLDTPGHEAFSSMRMRGAKITDIIILVVSADDGVMPQTIEAISHAKESNNPIIVAVNKIDKEGANPENVMSQLSEHGIQAEEWGGTVPFVKISALKGDGIDELLNYIVLTAEMEELVTPKINDAFGTVIESHLDKGKGPVATILVEAGEIHTKDAIIIGDTWGIVRHMTDDNGQEVKKATIGDPIQIMGIKEVPAAGDTFLTLGDNAKKAQEIGESLANSKKIRDRRNTQIVNVDELNKLIAEGELKELPIVLKADVHGSQEALAQALEKIEVNGVRARIVHKGVGAINESDVNLAMSSNSLLIAFNVRPDANARRVIEHEKFSIIQENVIYKIIEDIEDAMIGMREQKFREEIIGRGTIIEVFKISGVGKVAGVQIIEGKAKKDLKVRLIRDGVIVYDSELSSLKRHQTEADEVINGQDCGLTIQNYEDYKKNDELEFYELIEEDYE